LETASKFFLAFISAGLKKEENYNGRRSITGIVKRHTSLPEIYMPLGNSNAYCLCYFIKCFLIL